ncbi:hypothetical protein OZI05_07385 [Escherichia coli]|uniref:hypothetical protein n=1 Tax=Gammaproteobacteria TaxID=1236 RepID=UPI002284A137|nr:hypothetical protein [Escherichia coli]MCZ0545400.1 hypothetical protein [Escherichia coli]
MTDSITRADVERLQPHCLRLWPIIQQHPPGSAGRKAITSELNGLPAADRHIYDQLLDRMERVISFKDAWFPFYQGEVDTLTPPVKAKRVLPTGPTAKQVWKDTLARRAQFAREANR